MPEVRGPVRERTNAGAIKRARQAAEVQADRRGRAVHERPAPGRKDCVIAFSHEILRFCEKLTRPIVDADIGCIIPYSQKISRIAN